MTLQYLKRSVPSWPRVAFFTSLFAGSLACASIHSAEVQPSAMTARGPHASAQATTLIGDTSIFAPLRPMSSTSGRAATGAPTSQYWQNRADYALTAQLDTASGVITGTMVLHYTNHSPHTLDVVWFQTEQNAFRASTPAPIPSTVATATSDFGYRISRFTQQLDGRSVAIPFQDHQSVSKAILARPLRPGQTAIFDVAWSFRVPADVPRMGRQDSLYQIAQWYPRVCVYDDVRGWNREPYVGEGEFYLEYGDYSLALTVPANFIVGATGTLQNPAEVLTPTQIARLARAATDDSVVHVVTAKELKDGSAHLKPRGMVTWQFYAQNVRDMVFAAAPHYQWDATHWKGILVHAYYPPAAVDTWRRAAETARLSIQEYSDRWFPYPYPQISAAEGPVSTGMEYPMMSFDGAPRMASADSAEEQRRLYSLVTHEVGHNWFPMVVGSNERQHAWMDEGLTTFITTFSDARRYPETGDQTARAKPFLQDLEDRVSKRNDLPMTTSANWSPDNRYLAYVKPAAVLQLLRREVLGPELFDRALQTYVQRWQYKHPVPEDFFRTMEDVAGRSLSWFWREWFFETPNFDQAVTSVQQTRDSAATHVTIDYANNGRGVLPLLVRFTFSDSTTEAVAYPAETWRANSLRYTASYTFSKKTLIRVDIDPDHRVIDTDRTNNVWSAMAATTR